MTKRFKIGELNLSFTIKFRPKKRKWSDTTFNRWELGVWFKKGVMVGKKQFTTPEEWKNNHVNDYMFGVNLLVLAFWVSWDIGGMHLEM